MTTDPRLVRELRDIVGADQVLNDRDVTERYRRDWTNRFVASECAVVRPASTAEVAAIVEVCLQREVAIVPQGGNTGLVGGSVPLSGELVISTERLVDVDSAMAVSGELTVGSGTPLADIQRVAIAHGWTYGVDIASRDSATIGGTIATNAGGTRVIRYGDTRRQVLGVELVSGASEVVSSIGATLRDNTGYHLPSIVTGSEGTLGIITRARLRLVPQQSHRTIALMRFANEHDAVDSAETLRRILPEIEAAELFFGPGLQLVCSTFGLAAPFTETVGGYLLAEASGSHDVTAALAAAVDSLPAVADVAVADDASGRARLWHYRELHTDAIASVGIAHKLDVALPPGALADFVRRVPQVVASAAPGAQTWLFGHGGESSVHVNVTGPAADDYTVDDAVLRLVAEMGGSISAEHGIGRAKLRWLGLARDSTSQALSMRIKSAFDPAGIMNPAVQLERGS